MELTIPVYIALLDSEARRVTIPTGPYRLNATQDRVEECFRSVLD